MKRPFVDKRAYVNVLKAAAEKPLDSGCYLGFFISGTSVLKKIDDLCSGDSSHVVARTAAQLLDRELFPGIGRRSV